MQFPKTSRELKELFRSASTPDIADLDGEYLVDMLTVWPSFKRFNHRKVIAGENGKVSGYNVLFNTIWGRFVVEEDICRAVDSVHVALINYNIKDNTFPVRRIRDHVRCIEKGMLYIGRFNYLISGRLQFLGYFSLERIKR